VRQDARQPPALGSHRRRQAARRLPRRERLAGCRLLALGSHRRRQAASRLPALEAGRG